MREHRTDPRVGPLPLDEVTDAADDLPLVRARKVSFFARRRLRKGRSVIRSVYARGTDTDSGECRHAGFDLVLPTVSGRIAPPAAVEMNPSLHEVWVL